MDGVGPVSAAEDRDEPVPVGRVAETYMRHLLAAENALAGLSAYLTADMLVAHSGATPQEAEAVVGRVYRTHGGPTPERCAVTALAELSVLLGVTVTDVRRERDL